MLETVLEVEDVVNNLFEVSGADLSEELVEIIAGSGDVRIERIVSRGHASPPGFWYDQPAAEFVVLLSGSARLRLADPDEVLEMKAGDYMLIEPRRRHRVEATAEDGESVWLTVHYQRR
jgi:cupin 2 domain-containing protein